MKYRMIELVVLLVLFLQNPISNGLETNQIPEPSPGPTDPLPKPSPPLPKPSPPSPGPTVPGPTAPK